MLHEFWVNFTHNLFKLLLFFYFGFLIPIRFRFMYTRANLYLLWPSDGTAAKNS